MDECPQTNDIPRIPPPADGEAKQRRRAASVPGLVFEPNFLDEEHERRLVRWIDAQEWSNELTRRVQQYGWRYDYASASPYATLAATASPAVSWDATHCVE